MVPVKAYLRETPATSPNAPLRSLAQRHAGQSGLEQLHNLMDSVRDSIDFEVGATNAHTTAAEALRDGKGVCQDHAHVFITAARWLGIPARYVAGYMAVEDEEVAEASHAWAEAYVDDLGWVGFDVANRVCPDDRYIRVSVAMDARGARPVRGIRRGPHPQSETLDVEVLVERLAAQ
jgi:transglutaminase-like putative cysteine protease